VVAEAAFDMRENQGKKGGRVQADSSQYKTKERVTCIGSAECTSHKELFLATAGETRTAKLNIALHWPEAESPIPKWCLITIE